MTLDRSRLVDDAVSLPEGYSLRPAVMNDAEALARLYTVTSHVQGDNDTYTADMITRAWQNPHWDITTSSQICLDAQGQMVGYAGVGDRINPTHPVIGVDVHPGETWEIVMRALMAWAERRAMQSVERCDPAERFAPVMGCSGTDTQRLALLESVGYVPARYIYHMEIVLQEPPTVQSLPDGLTLRTFDYPAELEALVIAQDEIWQDHYGHVVRPLADVVEDWQRMIDNDPTFDATMWFLAVDNTTGQIAGLTLCSLKERTNPNTGHIALVGVRRAYRKYGLAQAMLSHAFAEYWRRGQKTIGLSVDADSPTGATRLYERVGMARTKSYIRLEKELRAGAERMNTGI